MDNPSIEAVGTPAEQAVEALSHRLRHYILRQRVPWSHDRFGTDFHRGEAFARTGLALIPELRAVLDLLDEHLGAEMEQWHKLFTPAQGA